MRQPAELWQYDVCVYDFSGDELKSYRWYENKHTKPVVVFVDKNDHPEVRKNSIMGLDQAFLQAINNTMEGRIVTCAYLIGDGFDGDWCVESVRELCRNRRAFRGNNLYSRGACYAMWGKLYGEKEAKRYIYLGQNKLKANVGMKVRRGREDSYIALLNGGDNWYDASKDCYCILESGNSFCISIVPLDGKNIRDIQVVLDGLTERPRLTTRLKISAFMETDSKLRINVTDMGFGTLFPASNQVFTKAIELYEG
jgi:hypothetical protein